METKIKRQSIGKSHTRLKTTYLFLSLVLIFTLGFPSAALAQDPVPPFTATPLTPDYTISVEKSAPVVKDGLASVIVKLKGEALATYSGDVPGLAPTSPSITGAERLDPNSGDSQAYLSHLEAAHNQFKSAVASAIPGARVTHDYTVIMNSVSMMVPEDQVSALYNLPEVEAVYPDQLLHLDTDNSPGFIGATTVWKQLGGQEKSGEGVIVGILDTGIWPEHPSFSDPDPSGKRYAAPPAAPSGKPRACQFSGGSHPGDPFTCNNKLIGAQVFMDTYNAYAGQLPEEFTSARDDDGHGTHTASTSAGNANVAASIYGIPRGKISGIAPRAHVMAYKVCGLEGCYSSDSAAAVQQAVLDGVNVINFSIGGGANPYSDAVELAFLDAYDAGVFVSASAGNSGPAPDTTDHRGPWVTTVAASTQNRAFANQLKLSAGGANLTFQGASITPGVGPAPVVVPTSDPYCIGPFAAGSLAGKIVVCERGGGPGRAEKGYNILQGGAVGMILYNQSADVTDVETDNHYLPATHIQYSEGLQVVDFVAQHPDAQATLSSSDKVKATGDVMASFSSRGGLGQTLGVSKPDITAPGVQILAGNSPQHVDVAVGPQGELFQAIAGTSMSSPHIAGAGALLKALHPKWTPGQIKSALMTTAWTSVVKEDGVTPATVFDDGSGRVDLTKAGDPGLTFDVTAKDYADHAADLWNVNYPSVFVPTMPGFITVKRTARNVSNTSSIWELSVKGETDFNVIVPRLLVVQRNGKADFTIAIDAKDVPIGQWRSATLYLTERAGKNSRKLHMPITFIRQQAAVTLTQSCNPAEFAKNKTTDCSITFANTSFTDADVKVFDLLPKELRLVPKSVSGASTDNFKTLVYKGKLAGMEPPDVSIVEGTSPGDGYLPLSLFGIAPISGVTDDSVTNFTVPPFVYGGETYTRIGVGSNGYVIVGGANGASDITPLNQKLPDATPPNNVLAPYWTDLNPPAGGQIRVGSLTDGVNSWLVIDWEAVTEFSTANANSFQVWIGTGSVQDVSFAFGPIEGQGDAGSLTTGAENRYGNRGASYYFSNGSGSEGTLPVEGTQLVVNSVPGTPGESHTITYKATGLSTGSWTNYVELTSNLFQGVSVVPFSGKVTKK